MTDVFDHPWLGGLFADAEMAALWLPDAQLAGMRAFEAAFSRALGRAGLADDPYGLPRSNMKGNVRKDIFLCLFFVFEPDMLKFDFSSFHLDISGFFVGNINFLIDHFHNPDS